MSSSGAAWCRRRPRACARRSPRSASPRYIGFDPTASSLHVGIAAHGHGAGAAAAIRPHADRPRRRRHRDDRRSERQVAGAQAAVGRADRRQRRAACARSSSASSTSAPRRTRRGSSTTPTGSAPSTCSTFLRDIGKHFTVELHAAEGIGAAGASASDDGISYTEFSYLLLQAYDFLHLFDRARAARCRWAAAISGATSPPASS